MKLTYLSAILALTLSQCAVASPWINSDDNELKHSIDLLVSHGLISRPVNQYPLLWQGIVQDLTQIDDENVPQSAEFALAHVRHALQQAKRQRYSSVKAHFDDASKLQDGIGQRQASRSGISSYGMITNNYVSAKVQVNYTDKALDGKQINHYGSHLAILYGNWAVSAERLNYWWGPANENALMLSNNAAPMKALRLSRTNSDYTGPSLFSFVGPWQVTAITAKQKPSLLDNRSGDFWGLRLSSSPLSGLEIAFSTTSSDFVLEQPLLDTKPAVRQRLTSLDVKFSGSLFNQAWAAYAEVAGNNDTGILPSENMLTMGIEHYTGNAQYRLKSYLEYSDSTTDCRAKQASFQCNFDVASGGSEYTQRQQWLGAAIGPQAKSVTLASDYHALAGFGGFAKLKFIDFENLKVERTLLELGYQQGLFSGLLKTGISVWQDKQEHEDNDTHSAVKLSWEYQF
ncbi:capsule assembly Wzi family protein [Pseudoalteromonas sp. JBTF-M23]|uniref:Capsule assembly Wzi family protein n=1 Tax=Pseudoalteromonas caenipelagi TaxID=2726988 RepID=A0A849VLT1_9GAMM|nr:capsule assembly Wzi family protein [Pseudoalteromonas caenipelagi]NOU52704.1 capsule assembly Wzi family protein [Pseudoalteromonas caenipelagi]